MWVEGSDSGLALTSALLSAEGSAEGSGEAKAGAKAKLSEGDLGLG